MGGTPLSFFHQPPLTPKPSPHNRHFVFGLNPHSVHCGFVALFHLPLSEASRNFGFLQHLPLHSQALRPCSRTLVVKALVMVQPTATTRTPN